jgi:hypothetical protein
MSLRPSPSLLVESLGGYAGWAISRLFGFDADPAAPPLVSARDVTAFPHVTSAVLSYRARNRAGCVGSVTEGHLF